jgi:hypothetical protein
MIIATINGQEFNIPDTWQDITLNQFINFLSKVEPSKPEIYKKLQEVKDDKQRQEIAASITDIVYDADILPYFARVISALSNIPYSLLLDCKKDDIEAVYRVLQNLMSNTPYKYQKSVVIEGETYEINERYMRDGTLGDYAEAAQTLRFIEQTEGRQLLALPQLLCILLRKKGEAYTDALLSRKAMFGRLDMEQVWNVFFFIQKRATRLKVLTQTYLDSLKELP